MSSPREGLLRSPLPSLLPIKSPPINYYCCLNGGGGGGGGGWFSFHPAFLHKEPFPYISCNHIIIRLFSSLLQYAYYKPSKSCSSVAVRPLALCCIQSVLVDEYYRSSGWMREWTGLEADRHQRAMKLDQIIPSPERERV